MKQGRIWKQKKTKKGKTLVGKHAADFLIVGGGVTGLFTAYYLLKGGAKSITVIEREQIGGGSTGFSAGMFVTQVETAPIEKLAKLYGKPAADRYEAALKNAMRDVRRVVKKESIACDYREHPLTQYAPGSEIGRHVEESISVNPVRFAVGMAGYLRSKGVTVYENTQLEAVVGNVALSGKGSIAFKKVIYATGTAQKHSSLVNYLTTICVSDPLPHAEVRRLHRSGRAMYWEDERGSFHYGKIMPDRRLLVGYGDVKKNTATVSTTLHRPHVRAIRKYAKRALGKHVIFQRAWSAAYSLSTKPLPCVSLSRGIVGGAGTQIASIAIASYFASALLGKKHPLDVLFKRG